MVRSFESEFAKLLKRLERQAALCVARPSRHDSHGHDVLAYP